MRFVPSLLLIPCLSLFSCRPESETMLPHGNRDASADGGVVTGDGGSSPIEAGSCEFDDECQGEAPACTRWSCNAQNRCEAVSLGEQCNSCGSGAALRVSFYDVEQGLSALVQLPDGRRILVDTGDFRVRDICGDSCTVAHDHLMDQLDRDVADQTLDLLFITHPDSDHFGGATAVLDRFQVVNYADNGRNADDPNIRMVHDKVRSLGVTHTLVQPGNAHLPLASSNDLTIQAITPSAWLPQCVSNRNACSILLRIDYCQSSILFTGDAEEIEEELLDTRGTANLLQVAHHGSTTSTGAHFLEQVKPTYAVISSGKRGRGTNRSYCHPRASTVAALTRALGGPGSTPLLSFTGVEPGSGERVNCRGSDLSHWVEEPASDNLWATARDGDVVLTTTGDGVFTRQ